MQQNTKYISAGIITALLIGLIAFYMGKNSTGMQEVNTEVSLGTDIEKETPQQETEVGTKQSPGTSPTPIEKQPSKPTPTPTTQKKGYYSYANAEYNFTIQYPQYVRPQNSFSTFHELGNNWRLFPSQGNQGKGILELSIFTLDQGSIPNGKQTYPLYFASMVRVGVSKNIQECYTMDAGYASQKVTNVSINGIPFKKFSTSDAAMMKYVQSESYRVIHNNQCFAIEQIKNGSNYRDEKMAPGINDTALNDYYNIGETIIKTFTFTK